mmetsp:Transcript_25919/g.103636  ORF Transcript_25919/g.103636 Transcript_25919/m.103636 type:complete len:414 (+) Transcript_25919:296-1537(+)
MRVIIPHEAIDEIHQLLVEAVPLVHRGRARAVVLEQIPLVVPDFPERVEGPLHVLGHAVPVHGADRVDQAALALLVVRHPDARQRRERARVVQVVVVPLVGLGARGRHVALLRVELDDHALDVGQERVARAHRRARADDRAVRVQLGDVLAPTPEPARVEDAVADGLDLAVLGEEVEIRLVGRAVDERERVALEEGIAEVEDDRPRGDGVVLEQPRAVHLVARQRERPRPARVALGVPVGQHAARRRHEQTAPALLLFDAFVLEPVRQDAFSSQKVGDAGLHASFGFGREDDVARVARAPQRAHEPGELEPTVAEAQGHDRVVRGRVREAPHRRQRGRLGLGAFFVDDRRRSRRADLAVLQRCGSIPSAAARDPGLLGVRRRRQHVLERLGDLALLPRRRLVARGLLVVLGQR